ncbi:hypothetical protein [Longirhabdus pacifica]|uniref:hypothetical protein n=1 Tax=Longirhabdus pacifica TaxID=2305227 RepID=UPI001008A145|nr:hypothetical protein [Longirhabdus pacifica]
MIRKNPSVHRKTYKLKQDASSCLNEFCVIIFSPCDSPCFCAGAIGICIFFTSISNADIKVVNNRIVLKPSKYLQNSVINFKNNKIIIRTFKYPIINRNRRVAFAQGYDRKKRPVSEKIFFNKKGKQIKPCSRKRKCKY